MYVPRDDCTNVGMSGYGLGRYSSGLGCAGGCGCGGGCGSPSPRWGMGIFDSTDFTTWGWQEWGIIAIGAYALFSMFSTSRRAQRSISGSLESRRRKKRKKADIKARRARLQAELAGL